MKKLFFITLIISAITFFSCEKIELEAAGGFESPREETAILSLNSLEQSAKEDAAKINSETEDLVSLESESTFDPATVGELFYTVYTVKKGDMVGFIADAFDITQDSITSVNNITNTRRVQIGQYLKIPSMSGILYTTRTDGETFQSIAKKYENDGVIAQKCAIVNNMSEDSVFQSGIQLFIPDAKLDWVTRQEINGDLFRRPIHSWYYISSRYGYRNSPITGKRSFHGGIDMACAQGTAVYAGMNGVVTTVSYNETYGNYVIITHHSGYKSLYAHLKSVSEKTKAGRVVGTESVIGYVGSTGLSTGPHLHFSIYKYGRGVNPANLWR
jgi:murein DD-endopeptidase MepM/ murein hydrolase activator NlpD